MYGLKPDDLTYVKQQLHRAEVIQVCVGKHDLQFHFHPQGDVSVQGRCELIDSTGQTVDVWEDGSRSAEFKFLDLLGHSVGAMEIEKPKSLKLVFDHGYALRIIDSSEQYESFSVGDLFV
jgi:hypothetical protein